MACQSKEAKKWLCFYLIHLIFNNFEVNYLSLPESYNTNLITLYNSSFHKFATMTWSFYQLHLSRNSGSQQSLGPIINNFFIRQHAFFEIWSTREVWRAWKMCKSCLRCSWEQLYLFECSLNFPSASYLDERTADVWTNCFITFSTRWKIFSRGMFADVMSVHNRNMKHARAIEFDYTNLLAML